MRAGRRFRLAFAIAAFAGLPRPAASHGEAVGASIPDLVEVADLSGLAISPDGETVAFRTERASIDRNTYVLEWRTATIDTASGRQVGGGGEPI